MSPDQHPADADGLGRWLDLPDSADPRGHLTVVEGGRDVPFTIARVFYVHTVAEGADRGAHAHRDTDQVLVALSGAFTVDVSDGVRSVTYKLGDPTRGLYLPRMTWVRMYDFSAGGVCLVFANTSYDPSKVIRQWPEYRRAKLGAEPGT